MGSFSSSVYEVVRAIPFGKVATYGQVARMIGRPRSARYVGYALHSNPEPWDAATQTGIPCHRVVFRDGSLTAGFAFGGPDEQRRRLEAEDVVFTADGRVDLDASGWVDA